MARITIGIPFFNCQDTLADTIRSVFVQTFQDWELILLDDGSTDNSLSIARSIKDNRVRVVSDGINKGIGARRREIVEMTQTDYLAWQDADDLMHPDRLSVQYQFLEDHQEIDIVDTSYFTIDPNKNIIRLLEKTEGFVNPNDMARFPSLTNGTSMAKTEVYKRFNYNDKLRRSEDWDVWLRALNSCKYYHLKDILYYRLDADTNQKPRINREIVDPKNNTIIYLKYGPKYLGMFVCLGLILRLYVRAIYRIALMLAGQHKRFRSEKISTLSSETEFYGEEGLKRILKAKLPGID